MRTVTYFLGTGQLGGPNSNASRYIMKELSQIVLTMYKITFKHY